MNGARFNFSHGSHPEHLERLNRLKAIRDRSLFFPKELVQGLAQRAADGGAELDGGIVVPLFK